MVGNLHRKDDRVNRFRECGGLALRNLFRRSIHKTVALDLYAAIVAQSRRAELYDSIGIPDTVDGRFEMICLHTFLVLRRLKAENGDPALSQALFDTMFEDMDRNLREMGAGDLGVGRRVKTMAKALYGRIAAYDAGLDAGPAALADALVRNAYGTTEPLPEQVAALADYMVRENGSLCAADLSALRAGRWEFGAVTATPQQDTRRPEATRTGK